MKWKGYDSKHNSWVLVHNCSCDELIHQFEVQQLIAIVGAKKVNDIVHYAIRCRESSKIRLVPSHEMMLHWSNPLIDYLEKCVNFRMPQTRVHFIDNVEFGDGDQGQPTQVLGANLTISHL